MRFQTRSSHKNQRDAEMKERVLNTKVPKTRRKKQKPLHTQWNACPGKRRRRAMLQQDTACLAIRQASSDRIRPHLTARRCNLRHQRRCRLQTNWPMCPNDLRHGLSVHRHPTPSPVLEALIEPAQHLLTRPGGRPPNKPQSARNDNERGPRVAARDIDFRFSPTRNAGASIRYLAFALSTYLRCRMIAHDVFGLKHWYQIIPFSDSV